MSEAVRIEILFNSVETELARRWAFQNIPPVFAHRPVTHLRTTVKAWWHLYQESTAARQQTNRTVWERNPVYSPEALETPELIGSLVEIQDLFSVESLLAFRPLSKSEESSMGLLTLIIYYYTNPLSERWTQIL